MEGEVRAIKKEGLLWGTSRLMPVGFGIKKLQITAVIEDAKVRCSFRRFHCCVWGSRTCRLSLCNFSGFRLVTSTSIKLIFWIRRHCSVHFCRA